MGTPEFSVPCLEMLINEGYTVKAVISQPDRPKGRGKKVSFLPVKETSLKYGIDVFQPLNVRDGKLEEFIKNLSPDLIITVAYGRILPTSILNIPKYGCINVHASLLPKYRGASPIQYSIINGDEKTGITTMFMDEGMDTGDILLKSEMNITQDMTGGQLHDALSIMGAVLLKDTLIKMQEGTITRIAQNNDEASYVSMLTKDTGHIHWLNNCNSIYNLVRGIDPYPGAYTHYKQEIMKVWKLEMLSERTDEMIPGTVYKVDSKGIYVACKDYGAKIIILQFPSSKRMPVSEYLKGHKIEVGVILGEVKA